VAADEDRDVLALSEDVDAGPQALGNPVVDARRLGPAEAHVHRPVEALIGLDHSRVRLVVIGRDHDLHLRHRAHQREVLDHLVRGAVLAEGDAAVGGADPNLEPVVGDAEADLVVGARAGEDREGGGVRNLAGGGEAAGDRHHVRLGGPDVEEALGELLPELHRLGRDREVGVERDDLRVALPEGHERVAVGLAGGDRLALGFRRLDQRAGHQPLPPNALLCSS
jgi:hypothetical protein